MRHSEQVRVLEGLMNHLDNETNVDAGKHMQVPVSTYLCPERAAKEWQGFFQDYPHVMGLSADLPDKGSFFTSDDLGKPILCTRDRDGKFHAFLNACTHRGTMIETQARGKKNVFSCPFHAWSYSPSGELVAVPREEHFGAVDKPCHSLVELPSVEKYGVLWVHPDPKGTFDIDVLLGDKLSVELSSWKLETMSLQSDTVYDHPMNWKLAIDTFGETYHFTALHKDTLAQDFYGNCQMYDTYGRNHRMSLCIKAIDTLRDVPKEDWDVLIGSLPVYYLFPNTQLIMTMAGPILVRVYPCGDNPNDSFSKVNFYLRPEVAANPDLEVRAAIGERLEGFGSVIRDEDYAAAATSHRGMASGALETVLFGRNEPALHHYHKTYNEALGLEAPG
jgi:nitrite reductase/ring-hydroxylating ferredoxin subunit